MSSRRRRFRTRPKPQPKKPPTNNEIKSPEVRLVGLDGSQLGVISTKEALALARKEEADLVLVAEKAQPPVARLLDVGKYMYEKRKKQARQRVVSKSGGIKGVRIGFKMGEHDWNIRLKQASKFLDDSYKVKLEIRLRGRERSQQTLAENKINQFMDSVPGGAKLEGKISKSPRGLSALLTR